MLRILEQCYDAPLHAKGNIAREQAHQVAKAASMGLITSYTPTHGYTNKWHITIEGLCYLQRQTTGTQHAH